MKFLLGKPGMGCEGPVPLIRKLTAELLSHLRSNEDSLPNNGRRHRAGQRISSAFVESAVNQLIDKRMSKSAADALGSIQRAPAAASASARH